MTDMTVFERQVAGEMVRRAGHVRLVDDLAVFDAVVAATSSQRWGSTMFSALKFIAAGAIVALFGGFLLAGILTSPQRDEVAPGAVTESPSPTTAEGSPPSVRAFPEGEFVSVENEHLMLEFGGDGTAVKHDLSGATTSFTYAHEGDIYTWLTSENGNEERYGQAQYAWDYDGVRLAFELLGEDRFAYRKWVYAENTYELVEDPQAVLVARQDLDIGDAVLARRAFIPAVDVGPGAYTSFQDLLGYVVAVPVPEGQPITPDLLESGSVTTPSEAAVTSAPSDPPDQSVRSDVLPGVALTVEQVEPGVLRVLGDGVQDLAPDPATWPVAGKDGGIWLFDEQGFFRLGTDGSYRWPADKMAQGFDVAPDGTVWTADVTVRKNDRRVLRIRSFDGETWTVQQKALDTETLDPFIPVRAFTITSDGVVWASWADPDTDTTNDRDTAVVARLGTDGWEPLAPTIERTSGSVLLFVTDTGEVWAAPPAGPILRYADGDWEPMTPEGFRGTGSRVDIGRDGTVWHVSSATLDHAEWVDGCPKDANCLMRYDGSDWQGWAGPDGLLEVDWAYSYPLHVAPDGSLWVIGDIASESKDGGIARFDGVGWRYVLSDRMVWAMDIAADGSVWFVASDRDYYDADGVARDDLGYDLYVITPEAVAATE